MAHKILTKTEIDSELKKTPDWSVKGTNIEASFEFKTFRDAIAFIVQIAIEAEVLNHHPEFFNSYNKVSFSFCTHDVGNKITDADIDIAGKISAVAHRFLSMK
jgi:4a-hydroxytetrahydrobiopterin dehydratase